MSWADEQGRTRDPYTPAADPTDRGNVWGWWTPDRLAAAFWIVCLILALLLTPGSV